MFQVGQALFTQPNEIVADERTQGQANRRIQIRSWGAKTRQESLQVAEQDKDKKRSVEWHIFTASLADDRVALADDQLHQKFSDVARPDFSRWNRRILGFRQSRAGREREQNHQNKRDNGEESMVANGMLQGLW